MIDTTARPYIDLDSLRRIGGEEGLLLEQDRLAKIGVDGIIPQAVIQPSTNEQAAEFLKFASSNRLKVAVRGGGTKTGIGNPIAGLDLVLSTDRLNQVLEYSPADLMLGVQSGANLQTIQDQLEPNGQFLPVDSPLSSKATIGGAIASNSSGPARLQYGPARDWLIGVRFVLAEGIVAHSGGRVVKNVAGYDLMKMFIGSLGTLGLILDLNFKLMPLPPFSSTLILSFDSIKGACETAFKVIDNGLFPTALTVLDNRAAKKLGLDAPHSGAVLAAQFRNTRQAVERQIKDASELGRLNTSKSSEKLEEKEAQKSLWRAVTDYPLSQYGDNGQNFVIKAGVLPANTAYTLEFALKLAEENQIEAASIGHSGHGIIYITCKSTDDASSFDFINVLSREVEANQGSVVVEQASIELKKRLGDVWGKALNPGELRIMREIKAKLDPGLTLNPGRFVGGI